MELVCPECGANKVRLCRTHNFFERLVSLCGIYPMKCAECNARFRHRIWNLSHLFYAKCPRCHKMDLARWSEHYYVVPFSARLKIVLGARRRRCVYCRNNFVSWLPLKEHFDAQKRIQRSHVRTPVTQPPDNPKDEETISG